LIRPIFPADDRLESHVVYTTDEFGFRNQPPIPSKVEVVVLGRSISLGAQQPAPWPQLLGGQTGWAVWNLSQPGSSIDVKGDYLKRYALPRRPRWVVIEVQPAIDITGYEPVSRLHISELAVPVLQHFIRPLLPTSAGSTVEPIYPVTVDLPGRSLELTCCLHYLDAQTVDAATLEASRHWAAFREELNAMVAEARSQGSCTAVLYAPSKPELYFPLAEDPGQLEPTLTGLHPLVLTEDFSLSPDPRDAVDIESLRRNAGAGRDLLAEYARSQDLVFIDPSLAMIASILDGQDPFMVYDSHWNQLGHQLVAEAVLQTLQQEGCP
jgi:hypothetical protein